MKKMILIAFLFLFYNCSQKLCYEERSIDELKKLYLNNELNHNFYQALKEYKLSVNDIKDVEKLIEEGFKKYNRNLNKEKYKLKKLPSFKKYGYILSPCMNNKGDKLVFVHAYWTNGNCSDLGSLDEWFEVCDGGSSMLQLVINLTKKKIPYVKPNGEA